MKDGMKKAKDSDDDDDDIDDEPKSRREMKAAARAAGAAAAAEEDGEVDPDLDPKAAKEARKEAQKRAREEERERKEAERLEAERLAKEEADKKAKEEFDSWKGMFEVDDSGEGAEGAAEDVDMLTKFVTFIKDHKVTNLEELASAFNLKASDTIARVQALEQMGHISGVVDDRGKFIYVLREELEAVSKFIKRKGRVRISALAQESNKLIDLNPRVVEEEEAAEEVGEEPTGEAA